VRWGALIGLVTGAVLSFVIGCDTGGDDCSNRLAMVPFTLPLLGGIGVGTGAGIGALHFDSRRPTPDSRLSTLDSRLSTPDS
jgi:hypothetical protein